MKQIIKNKEPRSLTEHRAKGGNYFNLYKNELRDSLLEEQGYICCYCMQRIPKKLNENEVEKNFPDCKIEHVKCQSENPDLELDYDNLLMACNGNHGFPKKMQTCDTFKGERDLSFSPADRLRNIENFIKYLPNGEIRSDDPVIDDEIDSVLNLNSLDLKKIREVYYRNFKQQIVDEGKRRKGKTIPKKYYEEEKQRLIDSAIHKFPQFCMVGVYLINKKLKKFDEN